VAAGVLEALAGVVTAGIICGAGVVLAFTELEDVTALAAGAGVLVVLVLEEGGLLEDVDLLEVDGFTLDVDFTLEDDLALDNDFTLDEECVDEVGCDEVDE
jgi:hypothetical protein